MYIRPKELHDQVFDFNNMGQNFLNPVTGLNATDHAMQYLIGVSGGLVSNPPQIINQNGSNGTDYSVLKSDNNPRGYIYKRVITGPGFYNDVIRYYSKTVAYSTNDPRYNQVRPFLTQEGNYSYFLFQKAILSLFINGSMVKNGFTIIGEKDMPIIMDGGASRGCDIGYTINVERRNVDNKWVQASVDMDYTIIKSEDKLNNHTISFHGINEYRVIIVGLGYNSNNNNFGNISDKRGLIIENQDTLVFKINTGIAPIIDNIKLPTITALVHGEDDGNGNFNKVYANKEFIISPDINYDSASWVAGGKNISLTSAEWLQELNNYCIVQLHIQGDNGVDILSPKIGLDQQKVMVPLKCNCHFKYITTVR